MNEVLGWLYKTLLRPLLFGLDAELAHRIGIRTASAVTKVPGACSVLRAACPTTGSSRLRLTLAGLELSNPLGLAAGLDKDAEAIDFFSSIGFGFVEVGTVTPGDGQPGNPAPRLYRAQGDAGLVNRMGFNNKGVGSAVRRLQRRRTSIPVGLNLGKAKETPNELAHEDYVQGLRLAYEHADYFTINVSSPNTPGLRALQSIDALQTLLSALLSARRELIAEGAKNRPLFLKLSPDLEPDVLQDIAQLALDRCIDGVVATNTTQKLDLLSRPAPFEGGLSGAPLSSLATRATHILYGVLQGRIPIIGVGGISTAKDALARVYAGASALQIYTALVYQGPTAVSRILCDMDRMLGDAGYASIADAVGAAHR